LFPPGSFLRISIPPSARRHLVPLPFSQGHSHHDFPNLISGPKRTKFPPMKHLSFSLPRLDVRTFCVFRRPHLRTRPAPIRPNVPLLTHSRENQLRYPSTPTRHTPQQPPFPYEALRARCQLFIPSPLRGRPIPPGPSRPRRETVVFGTGKQGHACGCHPDSAHQNPPSHQRDSSSCARKSGAHPHRKISAPEYGTANPYIHF